MTERKRLLVVVALGVAAASGASFDSPWQLTVLVGWLVTAIGFVGWTAASLARLGSTGTRAMATREDNSRAATRLLLVAASVVSLPGVAFALIKANDVDSPMSPVLTAAAIATVAASWALEHTIFTLRYADLYFRAPIGGVDFPHHDDPDYWEFAYLAFTVGMTFQVSDTDITSRPMRITMLMVAVVGWAGVAGIAIALGHRRSRSSRVQARAAGEVVS